MGYFPDLDWIKETKQCLSEKINGRLIGKSENIKNLV